MATYAVEHRAFITVYVEADSKQDALVKWMDFDEQALGTEFGSAPVKRVTVSFDDGEPDVELEGDPF